ncbi:MAG: FliH/SctL family protein [Oceanobacter sp.]
MAGNNSQNAPGNQNDRSGMLDGGTRPWRMPRWDNSDAETTARPAKANAIASGAAKAPSGNEKASETQAASAQPVTPQNQQSEVVAETSTSGDAPNSKAQKASALAMKSRQRELHDSRAGRSAPAQSPRDLALAIARSQAAPVKQGKEPASAQKNAARSQAGNTKGNPAQARAEEIDPAELTPPTAEELNQIRQQAAEEGRLQGLEEGRKQGHEEGYQQGFDKGKQEGNAEGLKEGRTTGLEEGKAQGIKQTEKAVNKALQRLDGLNEILQKTLLERDAQLPEMLAMLVMGACEQVLKQQLAMQPGNVQAFIQAAMARLPDGEHERLGVSISAEDMAALRQLQSQINSQLNSQQESSASIGHLELDSLKADPALKPGEVHIESDHTQVDYRVFDHLQQLLEQLAPMLLQTAPNEEELAQSLEQELDQLETDDSPNAADEEAVVAQLEENLEEQPEESVADQPEEASDAE